MGVLHALLIEHVEISSPSKLELISVQITEIARLLPRFITRQQRLLEYNSQN